MKNLTIILALSIVSLWSTAQTKTLTIEDATGLNRKLHPGKLSQLQWQGDSHSFAYVSNNQLVSGSVKRKRVDSILDLATLNAGLTEILEKPLKRFPSIQFVDREKFRFKGEGKILLYHLAEEKTSVANSYNPKAGNLQVDPHHFHAAYTLDHNIYISIDGEERQITRSGKPGIEFGSSVHRNEFGIHKGLFWSPKGNLLAFYRKDETMVADYPLVDIDSRIAKVNATKYPMAGMTSHEVTIGIYNLSDGSITYLKTEGPADQYLTNVTWSPDEAFIYVALLNRDQNHFWLNQYRVANGSFVKTLFEESNDNYVEPENGLLFVPEHPEQFIWESERNGYNHLYLYNTDGNQIRQLTSGKWVVTRFVGFDNQGARAFFMGNRNNPLGRFLYSVDLQSGEVVEITKTPGRHRDLVSKDGKYILDSYSSLSVASQTDLLDESGSAIRVLLENSNPLEEYKLGETTLFPIQNSEGIDLYCRLIKPVDFDPTKKYPVFIYVYGGPHSQLVSDSWLGGGGLFLNYMAQQGYVVFTLDNRGTANRGADFEQAIFRNLGTLEMADQITGVNYLKSLSWVDSTRIGINGWSYGGFMTLTMMLKNPGVFQVGVAGGPVIDWKYYEVMYGERYMDTPEDNPEGYDTSSLLNYVDKMTGDILIIQGYQDNTVVPQNSLNFLKKCVEEGKQVDFFIYPNHPHNVKGKDRLHLNTMIVDYFNEHLKGNSE